MLHPGRCLRKGKSTQQPQLAANPPAPLGLNLELGGREHYFQLQGAAAASSSPSRVHPGCGGSGTISRGCCCIPSPSGTLKGDLSARLLLAGRAPFGLVTGALPAAGLGLLHFRAVSLCPS